MLKKTIFNIDGMPYFIGYTAGQHWNGWACPFFTKEVCQAICDYIMSDGTYEQKAFYDEKKDTFFVCTPDNVEDDSPDGVQEQADGADRETEDGTLHLYAFGAYNWIWDDLDEVFESQYSFVLYYLTNYTDLGWEERDNVYDEIIEHIEEQNLKTWQLPEYIDKFIKERK